MICLLFRRTLIDAPPPLHPLSIGGIFKTKKQKNMEVNFYTADGFLEFSLSDKEVEAKVRKEIQKQRVKANNDKAVYFFKSGIRDAVKAVVNGTERKYGTPIVEVKNPFTQEIQTMTCQDARALLTDVGGNFLIRQISGSPLPKDYFENL